MYYYVFSRCLLINYRHYFFEFGIPINNIVGLCLAISGVSRQCLLIIAYIYVVARVYQLCELFTQIKTGVFGKLSDYCQA